MTATPVHDSVPLSGDPFIDGLVQGSSWSFSGTQTLTFSFFDGDPFDGDVFIWSEGEKSLARLAFQQWENVANIQFQEVAPPGTFFDNPSEISLSFSDNLTAFDLLGLGAFPDPPVADVLVTLLGTATTRRITSSPRGRRSTDVSASPLHPRYGRSEASRTVNKRGIRREQLGDFS